MSHSMTISNHIKQRGLGVHQRFAELLLVNMGFRNWHFVGRTFANFLFHTLCDYMFLEYFKYYNVIIYFSSNISLPSSSLAVLQFKKLGNSWELK